MSNTFIDKAYAVVPEFISHNYHTDGGRTTVLSSFISPCRRDEAYLVLRKALLIPFEELVHSIFYLHLVSPSEGIKLADINELAHGSVGL